MAREGTGLAKTLRNAFGDKADAEFSFSGELRGHLCIYALMSTKGVGGDQKQNVRQTITPIENRVKQMKSQPSTVRKGRVSN